MTPRNLPVQGTCPTCRGTGTVRVEIYNTATRRWQTITQACLDCPAR